MNCCTPLNDLGEYQLNGEFTKFTIPDYASIIDKFFKERIPLVLDLNNITLCDSALVALLISFKHDYPTIQFVNAPDQLVKLLTLYNVKEWFVI